MEWKLYKVHAGNRRSQRWLGADLSAGDDAKATDAILVENLLRQDAPRRAGALGKGLAHGSQAPELPGEVLHCRSAEVDHARRSQRPLCDPDTLLIDLGLDEPCQVSQ
jgi:hypothetical protein